MVPIRSSFPNDFVEILPNCLRVALILSKIIIVLFLSVFNTTLPHQATSSATISPPHLAIISSPHSDPATTNPMCSYMQGSALNSQLSKYVQPHAGFSPKQSVEQITAHFHPMCSHMQGSALNSQLSKYVQPHAGFSPKQSVEQITAHFHPMCSHMQGSALNSQLSKYVQPHAVFSPKQSVEQITAHFHPTCSHMQCSALNSQLSKSPHVSTLRAATCSVQP